jgi:hypothetical protein
LIKLCATFAKISEDVAKVDWLSGDPIFPNRDLKSSITITLPKAEIDSARERSAYRHLLPLFIACVVYRFPADTKSHYTGLIFNLFRRDPASPGGGREINPDEGNIPAADLLLIPHPFRSGIAN